VLSALGIGVGIAALTAISGIASSNQQQLLADLDDLGANLVVVRPGVGPDQEPVPLPETAPAMMRHVDGVEQVGVLRAVPDDVHAYRNDLIPVDQTNGLRVYAADPDFLAAVEGQLASGSWFDEGSRSLPVAVLGAAAAGRLGVNELGTRVWVGSRWYAVIGILTSAGLSDDLDASVFLSDQWVSRTGSRQGSAPPDTVIEDSAIAALYVRAAPARVADVRASAARAANPWSDYVVVDKRSAIEDARSATDTALSTLALGLSGVALLVGGIGIANTMIVAVLERRGEIGLRRALGARPGQIAGQFIGEALVIAALGGAAGAVAGGLVAVAYAVLRDSVIVVSADAAVVGVSLALVVGATAGLYPAISAFRVSPTVALRSI
jgi:putative ABC transport system permease protein